MEDADAFKEKATEIPHKKGMCGFLQKKTRHFASAIPVAFKENATGILDGRGIDRIYSINRMNRINTADSCAYAPPACSFPRRARPHRASVDQLGGDRSS